MLCRCKGGQGEGGREGEGIGEGRVREGERVLARAEREIVVRVKEVDRDALGGKGE